MIGVVALWNRLRSPVRRKARRRLRSPELRFERYGIDLLEKRQMLAVTPASDFTYTIDNGQVAITGFIGAAASVEIPATINSMPVASIGDNAFLYRTSITSVTIPESVTSIGEAAFYYCTSLTSVTMAPGVMSIGIDAFSYCDSLVTLSVPATVQYLGQYAVDGRSLKAIYFYGNAPNTDPGASFYWNGVTVYYLSGTSGWTDQYNGAVTSLFADSVAPTAVVGVRGNGQVPLSWTAPVAVGGLPVKDYTIQYSSDGSSWQTFSDAVSATTSATVTGLTNGTGYVFRVAAVSDVGTGEYSANSSVVTPSSSLEFTCTTSNGQITITGYNGSAATVEIPATIDGLPVTSIGDTAFQGKSLTGVTIPSSVKTIGYMAFNGCRSLTSITIPSSVNSIKGFAFSQCTSLTTVTIPASVASIGDNPFFGCLTLAEITVSSSNAGYSSRDGVLYTKDGTALLSYPAGRQGGFAIPTGVKSVGNSAFRDCGGLTSVTIPDSVTYLGQAVFWNCGGLTSIFIPDSVSSTNTSVLGMCENLRSARLSNSLTTLQGGFFADCQKLTDVIIPSSVTAVGDGAFKDCRSLVSIAIPSGVTDIYWEALRGCSSLTTVQMHGSPPTLGEVVFDGVDPTQATVYYPAGVSGWTNTYGGLPTKPYGVPEVPTAVTGVRGNGQVQLSWSAPASNVGVPVTDYSIQYSGDGGSSWQTFSHAASSATSATVKGLTNGTGYLFRVAAVNDVGSGLYSSNSSAMTPATTPGTPTAVVGVRGNGQVQLSWTAPVSNGGLSVTDYTIQYSVDSGSSWQTFTDAVSSATSATVTGLTNDTGYFFKVASVNDVGAGLYSANSSAVTPATTPGLPTAVVGVRGNGQVQLSWTAPVSNGGLSVTDYTIQYSTDGSSWQTFSHAASTATSATVTGLRNGTGYLFRVASVNDVGTGSFTATSSSITPNAVPLPPTNVIATRGRGVVTVSWTTPVSTVGVRITDYRVQQSTNGGLSWVTVRDGVSTSTRTVVSGLVMGRDYIFRVAAVGRFGAGDSSSPSRVVVPATVPSVPVGLLATAGIRQVALSWRAPTSTGGSPVSQYIVQYSPSAGRWLTSTTVASNTTTTTVGGLLANRSYSFRVLAVNDMGNSPASRVVVTRTLRPALVRG